MPCRCLLMPGMSACEIPDFLPPRLRLRRSHPCYVEIVKRLFYFHHRGLVQFCYNALGLGGGQGNAGKQPERRPRGQHRSGVSLRVPRVKESKKTSGLAQSDKSIKKMSPFLISSFFLIENDP